MNEILNQSVYEWKLSNNEMKTVHDGNIGDYIPCPIAINTPIIHNKKSTPNSDIAWSLSLYPTGNDHHTAQYSYISIHTRSIPHNISNIFVNYNIQIKEINSIIWSETNVNINTKHLLHILKPNHASVMLQSSKLKSCKTITFKIHIVINNITLKYKPTRRDPPLQPISNQINNSNALHSRYATKGYINPSQNNNNESEIKYNENDLKLDLELDDNILEYECYPSNITPQFNHIIEWTILNKAYDQFIHSNIGKEMQTDWFNINEFKFKLCCFPNGHKQECKGYIIMYLDIEKLPENVSNVRIHWNLHCLETGTYVTSMKDLNNTRLGSMVWSPTQLKLSQLRAIAENKYKRARIRFVLQLSVFHVEYYSKPMNSQFQYITQYKRNMKLINYKSHKQFAYEKCVLKWKLNDKCIEYMKDLCVTQCCNSPQFDVWVIRMYPQGINYNENKSFVLALKLLPYYLHRDIICMVVSITFKCKQLNILWNDIGTFNRKKHYYNWDIGNILKCKELVNRRDSEVISFEFTVNIMKLFGHNNKEIDDLYKYKYLKMEPEENENDNRNMMKLIKDLQKELNETKSEINRLKKQQKRNLIYENENVSEHKNNSNENDMERIIELNDVKLWFNEIIELPEHYNKFINDGFEEFDTIIEIKEQDLIEMHINKKGHRIKIINAINEIKDLMKQND